MTDAEYNEIFEFGRKKSRQEGIDRVMKDYDVNIIVAPSDTYLFMLSAFAGTQHVILLSAAFHANPMNQAIQLQLSPSAMLITMVIIGHLDFSLPRLRIKMHY